MRHTTVCGTKSLAAPYDVLYYHHAASGTALRYASTTRCPLTRCSARKSTTSGANVSSLIGTADPRP
eukprot:385028-Rhodomonas_salina.3